jgi:multiple sugar transport system substrate-binding protein
MKNMSDPKCKRCLGVRKVSLAAAVLTAALLSACGSNEKAPDNPAAAPPVEKPRDPVEITILSLVASITMEEFQRTMEEPLKKLQPHIKLNYIISGKEMNLNNMLAAGTPPDIVITSITGFYANVVPPKLEYDLNDLVKKHGYDLGRMESSTIESLRNSSPGGALYGLPKYMNTVGMFYNKDIFDKFGVPYPKDGMTWDDVIRLAQQMTRTSDGIQYRGLGLFSSNMIVENQLSLPFVDPNSDKPTVNTAGFQKLFQMYKSVYDIVGNKPEQAFNGDRELNDFYQKRNIAMVMSPISGYGRFEKETDFNWDLVAAPTFSDLPGVGFQPNTIYYFVSNANKKAEDAFLAVTGFLSDEVQRISSLEGRPTVLVNPEIRATLGQGKEHLKNKNFKALFYNKFATSPPLNTKLAPYVNASSIVNAEFGIMINNGTDVNTMLRTAEEKINQEIAKALETINKK